MTDFRFTEDDIRQRINNMRQHATSLRAQGVQVNTGYGAIQPYLDTIPAFTEDDVRQYILSHNQASGELRHYVDLESTIYHSLI